VHGLPNQKLNRRLKHVASLHAVVDLEFLIEGEEEGWTCQTEMHKKPNFHNNGLKIFKIFFVTKGGAPVHLP